MSTIQERLVSALKLAVAIADEAQREWDADHDARVGKLLIALSGRCKGYRVETDAIHTTLAEAVGMEPVICPDCKGDRRVNGLLCQRCNGDAQIRRSNLKPGEREPFRQEAATPHRQRAAAIAKAEGR